VYKSSPSFSVPGDKPEITPAVLPTFIQLLIHCLSLLLIPSVNQTEKTEGNMGGSRVSHNVLG
jgi:hypothetical protein